MSDFSAFLRELKRRKVFRVAGVYAAAAFVVLQVADLAVEPLGLPAWTMSLLWVLTLAAFPIALVLAWAFEVTPEGVKRAEEQSARGAAATEEPERAAAPRAARTVVAAVGFAVLIGLVGFGMHRWGLASEEPRTTAAAELAPTAVAVLPFSFSGGGQMEYLSEGMVKLLGTKLDGAGALRSVDPHALLTNLPAEPGPLGPEEGRRMARRFGAGLFILGNVVELGGRLHLDASLYSAESLDPVAQASVEGSADEVFALVDDLAAQLLAEQLGSSDRLARSAALTTRSIPALKAYLEGEQHYRAGESAAALEDFQRAVARDSAFALAWYRLALAAWDIPSFDLMAEAAERAVMHADGLSPRDRMLLDAFRAHAVRGELRSESLYRDIVARYPDDVEAWHQLGEVLLHANHARGRSQLEAIEPFERAAALDPRGRPPGHLYHMYLTGGRYDDALALARAHWPDDSVASSLPALARLAASGPAGRAAFFDSLAATRGSVAPWLPELVLHAGAPVELLDSVRATAPGDERTAVLSIMRGRWTEGSEAFRRAVRDQPGWEELLRTGVLAALLPLPRAEAQRLRTEIERWEAPRRTTERDRLRDPHADIQPELRAYLLGLLGLRLGDEGAARRAVEVLEGYEGPPIPSGLVGWLSRELRARMLHRDGRAAEALQFLEAGDREPYHPGVIDTGLSPFYGMTAPRWLRAALLAEVGRGEEALGWYRTFVETGREAEDFALVPLAHLRMAEILERQGERERAAEHYARAAELWRDGEAWTRPLVGAAREGMP